MTRIEVDHTTIYHYRLPVMLGAHRLMLRPRESRECLLRHFSLDVAPDGAVTWAQDVFGNAVATLNVDTPTTQLRIRSRAELELTAAQWPIFDIAASAIRYPFRYSDDEWMDLGMLAVPQHTDEGELRAWAESFVSGPQTDTLSLLKDLSDGVSQAVLYQAREEEGTQTPVHSLQRGWGSCRDLAVLFADAARSLGFGARIVSGYLFDATGEAIGSADSGSTHAWAEVYVPGAGWITYDATNRTVGGSNLIPVAVGRSIAQVVPVSGSYTGNAEAFGGMDVEIRVSRLQAHEGPTDLV